MWRERPTATLNCNVSSDKRDQKPGQKPQSQQTAIDAEGRQVAKGEDPVVEYDLSCEHKGDTLTCPKRAEPRRAEKQAQAKKYKIKWPKTNEVIAWQRLNMDLSRIIERSLQGIVEVSLNLFG